MVIKKYLSLIMFKALKYIILFLLGYKILKEIFGQKNKKNMPQRQNPPPPNHSANEKNQAFDMAEDIDYEELK